jgi:hypothetical protein
MHYRRFEGAFRRSNVTELSFGILIKEPYMTTNLPSFELKNPLVL